MKFSSKVKCQRSKVAARGGFTPTPKSLVRGFTLVEMLIVIAITSLLAGFMITYGSRSRNQITLQVETAKVTQMFLRAKSLTVSTYNRPQIPCGYGVSFSDFDDPRGGTYTLFSYGVSPCSAIASINPDLITPIAVNAVTQGLDLKTEPRGGVSRGIPLEYVLFLPPDPRTLLWLRDGFATSSRGEVYLETVDGSAASVVSVNSSGQVSY